MQEDLQILQQVYFKILDMSLYRCFNLIQDSGWFEVGFYRARLSSLSLNFTILNSEYCHLSEATVKSGRSLVRPQMIPSWIFPHAECKWYAAGAKSFRK